MTDLLTSTRDGTTAAETDASLRGRALEQLKKRRDFRAHLAAYVLVNSLLWLIWAVVLTTADGPSLPWPLFPMAGWSIGLIFHAWDTYGRKPFSEAAIEREAARLSKRADA